ncbi:MAG: putative metal-binding motif-containing protein [Bacteroidetes bacterium]|nr:putative metal-binding motif-containing protein [Bacteroidota bacterium]
MNIGPNFHGKIDELTIWNCVRTQAEIQSDLCGVTCPNPSLIAHYSFNQGITNGNNPGVITAIDNSGRNNNGTLLNFALSGSTSNWSDSYQLYEDLDNDGYGSAIASTCGVANSSDCDDNDAAVHDGSVQWYLDADQDHYYTGSPVTACHSPGSNYTNTGILGANDCDDNDASVHDSNLSWYLDVDGDHYYTGSPIQACHSPGVGYTSTGILGSDDCDDNDAAFHDGNLSWYLDADGDHYYTGTPIQDCHSPGAGYTSTGILGGDDCDDADPLAQSASQSWVIDADGDHYYVSVINQCSSPEIGYIKNDGSYYANDCNDNDAAVNPAAIEIPGNGIDENCNGQIDEILPCYPNISSSSSLFCISQVTLGAINNLTSCEATHYGAYTNLSTTVTAGSTQLIHLASSTSYSNMSVYIDWNGNNILGDDPSELVINSNAVQSSTYGGSNINFTVPSTVPFGNYVMRVISEYYGFSISDPCFTNYGEVEDYTITVGSCTPTIDYPCSSGTYIANVTIGNLVNIAYNCNGVTDYSSTLAIEVLPGSTVNYSLSEGGWYGAEAGISIYIDYNNDGDFNDVDEQVANFAHAQAYISDATGSFVLPPALTYGTYPIRVISDSYWVGSSDPCHTLDGEVKDYTLYVVPMIYCQPVITYPCTYNWITNVTIGSINNTSNCAGGGYTDYSFSNSTIVQQGEPVNYSVSDEGTSYSTEDIYVDFNSDGDFDDAGEEVATDSYNGYMIPATGTFVIPTTIPAGNYRMRVRSGNDYGSGACDNSNYGETEDYGITVTAINTCAPLVDFPCTSQWISHVIMGSINNTSDCSGGFANYASVDSISSVANDPINYTIEVHGYTSQQVNIFVDYNGDNDFDDADEHVVTNSYATEAYNVPNGTFYIPNWVIPGNYRIRVMTDTYTNLDADPCHIADGEVEDYMLVVQYPIWYRDFDSDYYGDPAVFVHAEFSPSGYVSDNTDCNDHNANAYPGAPEIPGNGIDDNCNEVVDELYCIPTGAPNHCANMWINRVILGTIDNSTSCTLNGYSDFTTTQTTTQVVNATVNYSIYGYGNEQKVSIYIDYNSDLDFDDAGEQVATNVYMQNNGAPASSSFVIPSTISSGSYRVRVISEYLSNWDPAPCTTYYGEAEDYTLNVVNSCVAPTVPTLSASSLSNCGSQNTSLNIVAGTLNDATDWKWYSGSCGGTLVGTGSTITVSPSVTTSYFARGEGGCVTPGTCGTITIEVTTPQLWYADNDGDGFGDAAASVQACAAPLHYVSGAGDCDDNHNFVHPGATEICSNGIDENCNGQIDEGCSLVVNLKVFIQGYYLGGGQMQAVVDPTNQPLNCDTLILKLASSTSPYQIQYTDTAILHTDGSVQFEFPFAAAGSHFFILRHRNALETWGTASVTIASNMFYDFTSSASQAFGNNMPNLGDGKFGLWSGDISNGTNSGVQDGRIDAYDFTEMDNDVSQFISSYHVADLTGDNCVESTDYSLIENNSQMSIIVIRP